MFIAQVAVAATDSAAVVAAATSLATSLAGKVTGSLLPGLDPSLAGYLTTAAAAAVATLVAWGWSAAVGLVHNSSTTAGAEQIRSFWAKYGPWINSLGASGIAALASHGNVMAALIPILLHIPPGLLNGFVHVAGKTTPGGVNRAGMAALLIIGLGVASMPHDARAADAPKVGWGLSSDRYRLAAGITAEKVADPVARPTASLLLRPSVILSNHLKAELELRQPVTQEAKVHERPPASFAASLLWVF